MSNTQGLTPSAGKETIAAIIPCFKVSAHIKDVITSLPEIVEHIIVVDDACPEGSGKHVEALERSDTTVICHDRNRGVGGAMISGYKKGLELGYSIMVKVDGDGQMDPLNIASLVSPLINGDADYTKGNRFTDFEKLKTMPATRLIGNSLLSFLLKASSGYWNIMDPTNGFTAIHRSALEALDLRKISNGYFFESDMLINLGIAGSVVRDVPMSARYGDERSSLSTLKSLVQFPPKLLKGLLKRIIFKYYIYDFNMASVYMLLGLPMFLFGVGFGGAHWIRSYITGEPALLGTIMLAALPIILAVELLLQAINIDINSVPEKTTPEG